MRVTTGEGAAVTPVVVGALVVVGTLVVVGPSVVEPAGVINE